MIIRTKPGAESEKGSAAEGLQELKSAFLKSREIAQRRGFCYPYPRSVSFSRSGCLSACKMLSMFCLIISYSRTFFFNFP